jgi:predicted ribosome quality control (RQC) complex YloA/Tae2 family protein
MRSLERFEYWYILNELKKAEKKHFTKAYFLGGRRIRLKFEDINILADLGVRINVAGRVEEKSEKNHFTDYIRKALENRVLKEVYLHNWDRVVVFDFGEEKLILEMFADGNAVFVKGWRIECVFKNESWRDRVIKKGEEYRFPQGSPPELEGNLSEKYIAVSLISMLGKRYAKLVLERCGIEEKTPGNTLGAEQVERIKSEIEKMKKEARPYGLLENGRVVDFSLVKVGEGWREYRSLSEVVEEYYLGCEEGEPKEVERLKAVIEKQKQTIAEYEKKAEEAERIAKTIYDRYDYIERIIDEARNENVESLLLKKIGARVDKKEKIVEFEI